MTIYIESKRILEMGKTGKHRKEINKLVYYTCVNDC